MTRHIVKPVPWTCNKKWHVVNVNLSLLLSAYTKTIFDNIAYVKPRRVARPDFFSFKLFLDYIVVVWDSIRNNHKKKTNTIVKLRFFIIILYYTEQTPI